MSRHGKTVHSKHVDCATSKHRAGSEERPEPRGIRSALRILPASLQRAKLQGTAKLKGTGKGTHACR
jgi:hypothetical protein